MRMIMSYTYLLDYMWTKQLKKPINFSQLSFRSGLSIDSGKASNASRKSLVKSEFFKHIIFTVVDFAYELTSMDAPEIL